MPRLDTSLDTPPVTLPPAAPAAQVSRRALILLTLLVAGVHAWLLQAAPDSLGLDSAAAQASAKPAAMVFQTRRVEAKPAQATDATARTVAPSAASRRSTPATSRGSTASTAAVASASSSTAPTPTAEPAPPAPPVAVPQVPADEQAPVVAAPSNDEPASSASAAPPVPSPGQPGQALVVPGPVRLNYEIAGQARGIQYTAQGTLTWSQTQGHYDAKLVASVFLLGSRTLTSTGAVTADGLVPQRFADKARSELAAHFLPDQGRISFSANTPDAPWQRGAQDRLSLFLQLASLMAGDPAKATAGTKVPLYVVGPRDAEEWVFSVGPTETLTLPMGATPTVYLLRQPRRDYDQKVEIWLAPQLGYLPVRIKQTQHNGDFVDQQLTSSSPLS